MNATSIVALPGEALPPVPAFLACHFGLCTSTLQNNILAGSDSHQVGLCVVISALLRETLFSVAEWVE
jgi:hypothetical protein